MEIETIKYRASFIAAIAAAIVGGVTLAAAAFHAADGRLPSPHLGEVTANPVGHQTSAGNTSRIYCYTGVKGDQDHLYRGWVCVDDI